MRQRAILSCESIILSQAYDTYLIDLLSLVIALAADGWALLNDTTYLQIHILLTALSALLYNVVCNCTSRKCKFYFSFAIQYVTHKTYNNLSLSYAYHLTKLYRMYYSVKATISIIIKVTSTSVHQSLNVDNNIIN